MHFFTYVCRLLRPSIILLFLHSVPPQSEPTLNTHSPFFIDCLPSPLLPLASLWSLPLPRRFLRLCTGPGGRLACFEKDNRGLSELVVTVTAASDWAVYGLPRRRNASSSRSSSSSSSVSGNNAAEEEHEDEVVKCSYFTTQHKMVLTTRKGRTKVWFEEETEEPQESLNGEQEQSVHFHAQVRFSSVQFSSIRCIVL